jgi:fibronectin-binding autotransporter adhesin
MFGQAINFGALAGIAGDEVDFLVLAGGGSGGSKELNGYGMSGGGGGAGGLRTSYGSTSGGGASAEDPMKLVSGTTYTVTVGAGGAGGYSSNAPGADSSIIGGSVSLTSLGGGAGRGKWSGQPTSELDGGSGGGADNGSCTYGMCNSVRAGGSGTTGQGYNATWNTCSYTAGGGGGAAGPGNNRYGGSPVICGWPGEGGNCLSVSITGSAVNYGAGGTSGSNTTNTSYYTLAGKCGIAGGSQGADPRNGQDAPGVNKGSGGSGYSNINGNNLSTDFKGGNGSSGVVILRMPTAVYSGTTTGSPTVTTDGTDTIIQFTGSGTYTH